MNITRREIFVITNFISKFLIKNLKRNIDNKKLRK